MVYFWRIILILVMVLILLQVSTVHSSVGQENFTTIYIRGNGLIETDPPDIAVNLYRSDDTYYLVGDIYGRIVVERDNILLDGRGYKLQGCPWCGEVGIYVANRSNVTIVNFTIRFFEEAIRVENSTDVKIANNLIENAEYGIIVYNSEYIMLHGNIILNSFMNGILMQNINNAEISFNTIINNYQALYARSSTNLVITYNVIYGELGYCGFYLYSIRYSIIAHNLVEGKIGIMLLLSDNNSVYNNLFDNSLVNYFVRSGVNNWNIPPAQGLNILGGNKIGGNAYLLKDGTGFSQECDDNDEDGFCDQPLILDLSSWNIDYYPLKYNPPAGASSPVFYIYTTTLTETITITHTTTQTHTITTTATRTITLESGKTETPTPTPSPPKPTTANTTIAPQEGATEKLILPGQITTPIEQIISSILIAVVLAIVIITALFAIIPKK